jgi:hypothetical protein
MNTAPTKNESTETHEPKKSAGDRAVEAMVRAAGDVLQHGEGGPLARAVTVGKLNELAREFGRIYADAMKGGAA